MAPTRLTRESTMNEETFNLSIRKFLKLTGRDLRD